MRVALLGFGLIGGSIARGLRADGGSWQIAAWSPSGDGPARARSEGIVDAVGDTPADTIRAADVVVLAGPPLACLAMIGELAGPLAGALGPDAVITDVASTKGLIGARADALGLLFVGGHPMAGREAAGYAASTANLFDGRPWVLVPGARAERDDVARVEAIVRDCRARPILLSAADHDRAVAGISHLPLVLAAALVEAVAGGDDGAPSDWPVARDLAASGWQGMTRLARGDVTMGAGILATNAPAVADRLRDLRGVIDDWLTELDRPGGPDDRALAERLAAARRRLDDAS